MKMLCSVQLSKHRYKTPEGYLVCRDCIIARTGKQTYLKSEIGKEDDSDEQYIDIDRKPEQVFDEKTMASFEGKPLTIEHPAESVSPENYKTLSVGNVHNVHRGRFEGQEVMYADINVYDKEAIDLIESGEMVELSCGYDCDITDGPNPEQVNIRGNHVALCEQGRAGIARIQDSKKAKKEWGIKPVKDVSPSLTDLERIDSEMGQIGVYQANSDYELPDTPKKWATQLILHDLPNHISRQLTEEEKEYVKANAEEKWNGLVKAFDPIFKKTATTPLGELGDSAIKDAVQRGTLIQEFGRYGEQYKIVKIDGNVMYCEELVTKKNTLFKRDKENIDWAVINKSQLNDTASSRFSEAFEKEIKEFVNNLGPIEDVKFDYASGYIPREHKSWVILIPYNSEYDKIESGPYNSESEDRALDKLKEEFTKAGYKSFIENNHGHIKVYEKSKVQDSKDEEKYRPNEYSTEFTRKELDEFIRKKYEEKETDAITASGRPASNRKKKIFINKEERDKFVKSLPEEAEVRMDEFDQTWVDKNDEPERWLVYWEVYYWDREPEKMEDSFAPLYIISLAENSWLDEEDRPTQDKSKARKFATEEEANQYKKIYCRGNVVKLNDSENAPFVPKDEIENIKNILTGINFTDIGESWGSLTIDFDDRKELRKAGKKLVKLYDIELFEDEDELYIAIYDKVDHPEETSTKDSVEDNTPLEYKPYNSKTDKVLVSQTFMTLGYGNCYVTYSIRTNKSYIVFETHESINIGPIAGKLTTVGQAKRIIKNYGSDGWFEDSIKDGVFIPAHLLNDLSQVGDRVDIYQDGHKVRTGIVIEKDNKNHTVIKYQSGKTFNVSPEYGNLSFQLFRHAKSEDSQWRGFNIRKGRPAEDFKQYLRDRGMEFEPSENGIFVHFEVKNPDEDVEKEIQAIINHYMEVGLKDSYSKRFYINAINHLNDKLKKLKRNELLDANQEDYEIQKSKMMETIEKQIEEYKKKLDEIR